MNSRSQTSDFRLQTSDTRRQNLNKINCLWSVVCAFKFVVRNLKHRVLSLKSVVCGLRSDKGFTLVEVMISVGILTVVIVGLLQFFIYASVLAQSSDHMMRAVNEAQTKMEEIRDHDFDSIVVDYASAGSPGNTFALTNPSGTATITVSQVGGSSQLLQSQIDVNWQNENGRSASTTLIGFIAKR